MSQPPYGPPSGQPEDPYAGHAQPGTDEPQPSAGQSPYAEQPPQGEPYPGQPYAGQQQPYPAQQQAYPGQQPYPGQQQPYSGQPYPGQPYGAQQPYPGQAPYGYAPYAPVDPNAKSKLVAGLLGIFLGSLGIHRFYLGYTGIGILQIVVTVVTFGLGGLWGFIEGIVYLAASKGSYTVDAQGRPLRA